MDALQGDGRVQEERGDGMSYIVPMEKPKRCGLCPCFHAEHPMHCQAIKASKDKRIIAPYGAPIPDWCPLVELPEKHGDLVDRDVLMSEVMDSDLDHLQRDDWKEVIQIVADAPTVIEAEGSET